MSFRQLNVRLPEDVRCLIPKGNMAGWVSAAIRSHYESEVARGRMDAVPDYARRGRPVPPPVVDSHLAAPTPPQRHAFWIPSPADFEAGFYVVKPESFAAMDGGSWHFIQVEPGTAYPFTDGWTGQRVKWKPAETAGPFVPDAGVLEAALAFDAARVAAILAKRGAV